MHVSTAPYRRLIAPAIVAAIALLLSAPARYAASVLAAADRAVFPAESWNRIAAPESAGFSRAKLERAVARARTLATTSFVAAWTAGSCRTTATRLT